MNRLADYHTHTARCGHAVGTMDQYVQHAIDVGLAEIGFSDHLYLYWMPVDQRDPGLGMAEAELPEYVDDVLKLRAKYPSIPIRLGLEADYIPGREEQLATILEPYPWDYVYGSVHFIGDWAFDHPDYQAQYAQWNLDELYRTYFDLMEDAARSGLFDILGHLDVIKKFGHRPKSDPEALYDEVAQVIGATGVGIEVSTAGLRKPVGELYPAPKLLAACARHGVPASTGSDAHAPSEVGIHFDRTVAALKAAGYRQVQFYQGRQKTSVDL